MSMMMREDDADILERGFDDSSAPATPYEPPRSLHDVLSPPPSLDLGESNGWIMDMPSYQSEQGGLSR